VSTVAGSAVKGTAFPSAEVADCLREELIVAILCAIEPIVGFELPESLVRTGGYRSVVTALDHLLPRIEKEWMKKKGVTS
jgi:hypothetical protein